MTFSTRIFDLLSSLCRRICLPVLLLGIAVPALSAPAPRILLIGIDAIPYRVMARLTEPRLGEKALFKAFSQPTALVSTFPSDSHVAWSSIVKPFGIRRANGYQPLYFDNQLQTVNGGVTLVEHPAPWEKFFDWRLTGMIEPAIAYGWPQAFAIRELEKGLDAFFRSDKPLFRMYIVSTDGIAHTQGPDALESFLIELDRRLQLARQQHTDQPFYTLMISDHGVAGGEALVNIWPDIEQTIKEAGYSVADSVASPNDTAIIAYGLLNSFVVHATPGREAAIAERVTSVKGVDLCVGRVPGGWRLYSARGQAQIASRVLNGQLQWSYHAQQGDPLNYLPIIGYLKETATDNTEEWFTDQQWFSATKEQFYPDALSRLAHSFEVVENAASLVCSVSPGYMFGARKTDYTARLTVGKIKWTHGALHRDASLGFMMTDIPNWPSAKAVRSHEALAPLATRFNIGPAVLNSAPKPL